MFLTVALVLPGLPEPEPEKIQNIEVNPNRKLDRFNPNKGGGGRNQPTALSMAYRFVCDEVRSVKPSCIFHFWCLKQVKNINLGGCI